MDIEDCITRGVAFLDAAVSDWRERINLDELDLSDTNYCVLGQVYRHDPARLSMNPFTYGSWKIHDHVGLADDKMINPSYFGFDLMGDFDLTYDELTDIWANEVSRG